jgi:hypothetical protein
LIAFRELVCGWEQVKHQLKRFTRRGIGCSSLSK